MQTPPSLHQRAAQDLFQPPPLLPGQRSTVFWFHLRSEQGTKMNNGKHEVFKLYLPCRGKKDLEGREKAVLPNCVRGREMKPVP